MADGFNSISSQERALSVLSAYLRAGTVPHALLFSGIEGVGKKTAALYLALACNCTQSPADVDNVTEKPPQTIVKPCDQCKACRKIRSDSHPDVITVKPQGVVIKIEQIRSLCHTLALKPYEARCRVVIICDADAMNASSSNALLKVLEEPPQQTILVLVSTRPEDLLPTVVSRCQRIRFDTLSESQLARMLSENGSVSVDQAAALAALAGGSASRARQMLESRWPLFRNWILGEIDSVFDRQSIRALAFAEKLALMARDQKDPNASEKRRYLPLELPIVPEALAIVQAWYRDLLVAGRDPDKIINKDFQHDICAAAGRHPAAAHMAALEEVCRVQRLARAHPGVNIRLLIEAMVTRLMQIAASCDRIS